MSQRVQTHHIKFPSKPLITPKDKDKKPCQRDGTKKGRLDEETQSELRREHTLLYLQRTTGTKSQMLGKGEVPLY